MAYNLLGTRQTYYVRSGSSSPTNPDIRAWGKTYYEQTSSDLANNQSKVKVEFGSYISDDFAPNYMVTARIQVKNSSGSWVNVVQDTKSHSGNQTKGNHSMGTITATVPHDVDGTKKIRTYITIQETYSIYGSELFQYTYTLPTIAQSTECGNISLVVEQTSTFNINPKNNAYTHSLLLTFGSLTKYVGENGVLTDTEYIFEGNSTNIVCPTSFYGQFTGLSATGTATLKTYYNGTQVGSATTGTLTVGVNLNTCGPDITSVSFTDLNETTTALTGNNHVIIPNYSTVRITPTIVASSQYDTATTIIEKYIDGVPFNTSYYNAPVAKTSYQFDLINSRQIQAGMVFPVTNTINYTPVSVNASSNFDRTSPTSNDMKVTFSGIYWAGNFGATSNSLTIKWYVKEKSASGYTLGGTFAQGTDYTISNNTFTSVSARSLTCPLTGGWSYQKAYEFKITAEDKLDSYEYLDYISKGKPIYYWYEKNDANYFKVNGTLQADDLKINNNGLLNLIYPIGSIYTTTDGTFNPNTTFGGNWQQIKDVFLLAAGNTYAGGSTGGSADLQAHTHTMAADFYIRHGNTSGTDIAAAGTNTTVTTDAYSSTWGNGIYTSSYSHKPDKVAISGNTGSTGDGNQGNMPPYLAVYVWKRTA